MIALLIRDLRLAMRAGGGFGLGLAFFLIVTVLVPFGVGPEGALLARVAPGVLWLGALLACLLSLDRIFALDHEDGSLDLLATAPVPLEGVVAVKACAHWLTTGLPLTLAAPGLGLLLNLPGPGYLWLTLSLAAGTPALSVIGAFGAALTVGLKRGGADADLRRRGGTARRRGAGGGDTLAAPGRDQRRGAGASALRRGCGNSHQPALARPCRNRVETGPGKR
jgi:heme exporter protein B